MNEKTLAIIKPDGVARGLIGAIIKRLEDEGFNIIAIKMIRMTKTQAMEFYKDHEGQPYFDGFTDFMSSGPCVVMVLKGEDAIKRYRKLMGATNFKVAEEGTIRREYATDTRRNLVHGSDSNENAQFEIGYFFNAFEIAGN